mmetsp:Transcript_53721/g.123127  ORF Transcript_53721/g.123127 Transcript_53721/m.123127 type:complete len:367 (+) Transcript_53721:2458-3558(+)
MLHGRGGAGGILGPVGTAGELPCVRGPGLLRGRVYRRADLAGVCASGGLRISVYPRARVRVFIVIEGGYFSDPVFYGVPHRRVQLRLERVQSRSRSGGDYPGPVCDVRHKGPGQLGYVDCAGMQCGGYGDAHFLLDTGPAGDRAVELYIAPQRKVHRQRVAQCGLLRAGVSRRGARAQLRLVAARAAAFPGRVHLRVLGLRPARADRAAGPNRQVQVPVFQVDSRAALRWGHVGGEAIVDCDEPDSSVVIRAGGGMPGLLAARCAAELGDICVCDRALEDQLRELCGLRHHPPADRAGVCGLGAGGVGPGRGGPAPGHLDPLRECDDRRRVVPGSACRRQAFLAQQEICDVFVPPQGGRWVAGAVV